MRVAKARTHQAAAEQYHRIAIGIAEVGVGDTVGLGSVIVRVWRKYERSMKASITKKFCHSHVKNIRVIVKPSKGIGRLPKSDSF
jgi:hypothetical protein